MCSDAGMERREKDPLLMMCEEAQKESIRND